MKGSEHPQETSGKTGVAPEGGANSGALGAQSASIDADLQVVIQRWPKLPEGVRRQVIELVREC